MFTINAGITGLKTVVDSSWTDNTFSDVGRFYSTGATAQTNGLADRSRRRNDPRIWLSGNCRSRLLRLPSLQGSEPSTSDRTVNGNVPFAATIRLQLRTEFLNAFNMLFFDNPNLSPNNANFGRLTSQTSLPPAVLIRLSQVS